MGRRRLTLGRLAARVVLGVALAYIGFVALLYVEQRKMQYVPDTTVPLLASSIVSDMQEVRVTTADGLVNTAWVRPPVDEFAQMIIMFHGNADNIGGRAVKARGLMDVGYGFALTGYRGYGGNAGAPTEEGLYADARAMVAYVTDTMHIPLGRIVFYGESLGTGVATKMAEEYPGIAGLVLEVPFDSALAVAQERYWFVVGLPYLMHDHFRSDLRVPHLMMPKLILVAGRDQVVPGAHARHLYDLAAAPKEIAEFAEAGHSNLYDFGARDRIVDFIHDLPVAAGEVQGNGGND